MTLLVTGSAGHLGEALMRTFQASGTPACGLDLKASPFTQAVGSITDPDFVRDVMAGVSAVVHTATLHKPHIATHSRQDFVDVNVSGTLTLLEAAVAAGAKAFIYTSTTSAFGSALTAGPGEPATWITEDVPPVPKNIYGATKIAAENLCELFARQQGLPVIILRTSRFFPEADDDADMRGRFSRDNAQAAELLYRRADIDDMVSAHLKALEAAPRLTFGRYIISATTPFSPDDLPALRQDPASVVRRLYPDYPDLFAARGWRLFDQIDRVYVNAKARDALGWRPRYDFRYVLDCLARGEDFRSPLARSVGSKGYHDQIFAEGPYPVL